MKRLTQWIATAAHLLAAKAAQRVLREEHGLRISYLEALFIVRIGYVVEAPQKSKPEAIADDKRAVGGYF